MSDSRKEEDLSELERERRINVGAVGGLMVTLLGVAVIAGLMGAVFSARAVDPTAPKPAVAMVVFAGIIFAAGCVTVFHFALKQQAWHTILSVVLVFVFLGGAGGILKFLEETKPEAKKKDIVGAVLPTVETVTAREYEGDTLLEAEGIVESQREISLTAEVTGKIVEVNPSLVVGGEVRAHEVLLRIEQADFRAAREQAVAMVERARSVVSDAVLMLEQEEARREQALRDWEKLGEGEPSDLLVRKPQIASAKARLQSAKADVQSAVAEVARAERNLERTVLRAPFDSVVRQKSAEVGVVATPGAPLVTLFSEDNLEVELELSLEDYALIQRDESGQVAGEVVLSGQMGSQETRWSAKLVRTTGEIRRGALTAGVVAEIDSMSDVEHLPPPGFFVEAEIKGQSLLGLVSVPREAVRSGNTVYVVSEEKKIERREIEVVRSGLNELLVSEGVEAGDEVVLTRLFGVSEGMEVMTAGEEEESKQEEVSEDLSEESPEKEGEE